MTTLDIADLLDVYNRMTLYRRMIYAAHASVPAGKVFHCKETAFNYEYFLFHSDEEAQGLADKVGRALVHIRDAPKKLPKVVTDVPR